MHTKIPFGVSHDGTVASGVVSTLLAPVSPGPRCLSVDRHSVYVRSVSHPFWSFVLLGTSVLSGRGGVCV